jgi:Ser-tRNA(Ala) deacylase AlaX
MTWTGGGQPNDTGVFRITPSTSSDVQELQVINVQRRGLSAVHHVKIPKELHGSIEEILKSGVKVDMQVDWDRRWDHVSTSPT